MDPKPSAQWLTPRHGIPVERYPLAGSTIDIARERAGRGEVGPKGLLILADRQSAGRGSKGRSWHSPTGSLSATYVVAGLMKRGLGILVGVAAVDAAADELKHMGCLQPCHLRWPNDVVFVTGEVWRKAGGCLAHAEGGMLMASVGMNVNNSSSGMGNDLRTPAISLAEVAGREVDLRSLAGRLGDGLAEAVRGEFKPAIRVRAEGLLAGLGSMSMVGGRNGGHHRGVITGLTDEGGLRLKTNDEGEVVIEHVFETIVETDAPLSANGNQAG